MRKKKLIAKYLCGEQRSKCQIFSVVELRGLKGFFLFHIPLILQFFLRKLRTFYVSVKDIKNGHLLLN